MVIYFHTHCFPERIARSALDKLGRNAGSLEYCTDGTLGGLRRHMAECGVDIAVVLNIATSPAQQRAVNDFAIFQAGPGILPFGSGHPFAPDALDELERIAALGLKGVKFHPQFQGFAVDDEAVFPVYRKAASLGLVTVFHAGLDLGFADSPAASPEALARALPEFGGAPVVAAHLGGCMCWREAYGHLAGLPVWFDTAFCHGHIPLPEARRLIDKHGVGRILFGSDLPWSDMAGEIAFVESLGLGPEDTARILFKNAAELLGVR
jgi:predicted TIM-barrel fold metal-dependent hydrolase